MTTTDHDKATEANLLELCEHPDELIREAAKVVLARRRNPERLALVWRLVKSLGFDALEARCSDRLDVKRVHVADLREALEAAFAAGERAALQRRVDATRRELEAATAEAEAVLSEVQP